MLSFAPPTVVSSPFAATTQTRGALAFGQNGLGTQGLQQGRPVGVVQYIGAYPNANLTFANPNVEGNCIIVWYMDGVGGGSPIPNDAKVADTNNNSYEELFPTIYYTNTNIKVWIARNIRPGSNTVTVTRASAGVDPGAYTVEVSGASLLNPVQATDYGRINLHTVELPSTVNGLHIIAHGTEQSGVNSVTFPTGWTRYVNDNGQDMSIGAGVPPNPGVNTYNLTTGVNTSWIIAGIALQP